MRIDFLTVLPEMVESPLACSIMKRAAQKGLVEFHVHNLRDYTTDRHRKVDDYPFGGEAGMVMKIEPVDRCLSALKAAGQCGTTMKSSILRPTEKFCRSTWLTLCRFLTI